MILIENGMVYTMNANNDVYDCGCILIDGGKILEVARDRESIRSDISRDVTVINAKGRYVFPGFVDPHCHIGLYEDSLGFEGEDTNESTDPVTPQLRAIDGINFFDRNFKEAYEAGVTTVVTGPGSANVLGGQFLAMKTYGRRIEEMIVKDPVAVKIAFGENPKSVYNERKQMPTTRMATAAILREELNKAVEYNDKKKIYASTKDEEDKPEYDGKLEVLIKVLNKEIPFKAHAHRADDILTAIRIAKEFDVNITIEHCTDGSRIKDILKSEGVPVIVGPVITDRSKPELANQSASTGGILAKEGIDVAIMTDHPVFPINYLPIQAAIVAKEGMDCMQALRAITITAAKVCGIDDRVGSIEVNKDADIVIFDGHPFEIKTNVLKTIIDGEVVYDRD
ncbi:MAG: amidohydrolase [Clostridiales bacterium]|nr:amidohydrolase [Clostridiales bacterium]